MSRECTVCGKIIPENAHGNQKFCSAECRRLTYRKQAKISNCLYCGKELVSERKPRMYCDWKCRYEHLEAPRHRKERKFTCLICGNVFSSSHSTAFYCSDACRKIAQRKSVDRYMAKTAITAASPRHKCHFDGCKVMTRNYFCHIHRRKFKNCSFMPELAGL